MKAVYLEWLDHCSFIGWRDDTENMQPKKCISIGWLIHEDKTKVIITNSFTEDVDFADPLTIIKSCITKRRNVKLKT